MLNDHQDMAVVTTPACPFCGEATTLRVDRGELQQWIDADGAMPFMAAFPTLSVVDHMRLATGVHLDCPATDHPAA